MAPEIPDFSILSPLGLISILPSTSALTGLQAGLACVPGKDTLSQCSSSASERCFSLPKRHQTGSAEHLSSRDALVTSAS